MCQGMARSADLQDELELLLMPLYPRAPASHSSSRHRPLQQLGARLLDNSLDRCSVAVLDERQGSARVACADTSQQVSPWPCK